MNIMKTAFSIFPSVKTICCVAAALMAMWPSAMAVPAFPGKGVITQPDGSVVTVRLIGDEHSHITVTDDGYTILPDAQGRYCYARKDATGMLVSSGIECHEPAERGASELALVASLPKRLHIDASAKSLNTKRMNVKAAPLVATRFPTKGDARSLVLLVDFSDKDFVTENTHQVFTDMLNKPGYDAREHIGCAADYFRSQSMGAFNPSFDVYGPVKMPKSVNYYGENDENGNDMYAYEMVVEACRLLDGEIDFSRYDLDGDGCVDNVYVFYAGYGENFAGAKSSWIWPHAYYVSYYGVPASDRTFDGVIVDSYGCCAELYGTTGTDTSAMGTFCHEFGHILGLPDTYDVNYDDDGAANHPGVWDVMSGGSYLPYTRNSGAVPAGYNGMERYLLGWAEPVEITMPQSVSLQPLQSSNTFLRISTSDPDEYFLLENRQTSANTYDRYLPSHGMLIWHVDRRESAHISYTVYGNTYTISCADAWNLDYNAVNCNYNHQCLELLSAAGSSTAKSSTGTPYPGQQMVTSFTDTTDPAMKSWTGVALGTPVTGIREINGVISFDFCGGGDPVVIEATEATNIGAEGFTANWMGNENVDQYRLHLWKVSRGTADDVATMNASFTSMPDGWSSKSLAIVGSGGLTMGTNAVDTLSSPQIDLSRGGRLVVTARQQESSGGTITVFAGNSKLAEYLPSDELSDFTIDIPAGTDATQLRFAVKRRKPVVINRIALYQTVEVVDHADVDGYPVIVDAATSLPLAGLEYGAEYAYAVEAVGYASSISNYIYVTIGSTESGIEPQGITGHRTWVANSVLYAPWAVDNARAEIYSIAGSKVASQPIANGTVDLSMLGAGAYIAVVADNNVKTTIKFIKQ